MSNDETSELSARVLIEKLERLDKVDEVLKDIDLINLFKRLEKIEKVDLGERLTYIEKKLNQFAYAANSIESAFRAGIKVSVDEQALSILEPIQKVLTALRAEVNSIGALRKDIQEQLKNDSVIGTLQFVAKRLHELTEDVYLIRESGIKKEVHLALTMDGYEMVKKKPSQLNPVIEDEDKDSQDNAIQALLETLTDRERKVLIHRFGLLGEKKKTQLAIAKLYNLTSGESIRRIEYKALRKCRHPARKKLAENITHLELRQAILGKDATTLPKKYRRTIDIGDFDDE